MINVDREAAEAVVVVKVLYLWTGVGWRRLEEI